MYPYSSYDYLRCPRFAGSGPSPNGVWAPPQVKMLRQYESAATKHAESRRGPRLARGTWSTAAAGPTPAPRHQPQSLGVLRQARAVQRTLRSSDLSWDD